jgi:hypothetical protein
MVILIVTDEVIILIYVEVHVMPAKQSKDYNDFDGREPFMNNILLSKFYPVYDRR